MALNKFRREPLMDIELFSACTPAEATRVRSMLTLLTVDAGTVLMRQGSFGFEFLVIADGQAEVSIDTPDGETVVATLNTGDFAGEMSLLAHERRSATVTALTPVTFYVANLQEFAGILEVAPGVAEKLTTTAAEREQANRSLTTLAA
jgi:protein lysine acetyltransferase